MTAQTAGRGPRSFVRVLNYLCFRDFVIRTKSVHLIRYTLREGLRSSEILTYCHLVIIWFWGFHFTCFDQLFFMITDKIHEVLTTGIGHIGCVSSSLRPFHSDVLGVIYNRDSEEISCCLNKESSEPFLNNLVIGSTVSLFVGAISHEAYNIKGPVTALRDVQENEKFVCDKLRHGIYEPFAALGITQDLADRYWLKNPNVTVVFKVNKIFIQTPGPEAGKQV